MFVERDAKSMDEQHGSKRNGCSGVGSQRSRRVSAMRKVALDNGAYCYRNSWRASDVYNRIHAWVN